MIQWIVSKKSGCSRLFEHIICLFEVFYDKRKWRELKPSIKCNPGKRDSKSQKKSICDAAPSWFFSSPGAWQVDLFHWLRCLSFVCALRFHQSQRGVCWTMRWSWRIYFDRTRSSGPTSRILRLSVVDSLTGWSYAWNRWRMVAWLRPKVCSSCCSGWKIIQRATLFGCGIQVIIRPKNITRKPCWFDSPLKLTRAPVGEAFSKAACCSIVISAPANPVPRRLKNFKMCWLRLWALWHCVWVCLWGLTFLSLSVGLRTAWSISSCGRLGCGCCSCLYDTAGHPNGERSFIGVKLRNADVSRVGLLMFLMERIDRVNLDLACNQAR